MWVGEKKLVEWFFRIPLAQEEALHIVGSLICAEMEKS